MTQRWKIVGGADKGGILVRDGVSLKSVQLDDRLATGTLVEEIELQGDRLHYKRLDGTGPDEGWISLSLKGKILAEPEGEDDAAEEPDEARARIAKRCRQERNRKVESWKPVSIEQFQENYNKELPGIRYGLTFPHNAELLTSSRYGAAWLTKAFHAAGTLDKTNKVKQIIGTRPFVGGGACLKAFIDVEYENPSPDLHTELFMKYPYNYDDKTQRSDRMNSSVNLQTMDLSEVDAHRLLEYALPVPMAKYYFGDVSNESTNFVLITERIKFGSKSKPLQDFAPNEVEPAYDKFLDFEQFKPYEAVEYYRLMTQTNARIAAAYKTGKLGDHSRLAQCFRDASKDAPQGEAEAMFKHKIKNGEEFLTTVAKQMFPPDLLTDDNVKEWKRVLSIVNAYKAEIAHAAGMNDDYCAVMHGNMNPDNTWFWRDEDKRLHIGALDWGGLSKVPFGPKLWWSFYAAEIDMFENHLDELLSTFADTYESEGGPKLDTNLLWRDFMLAALDQAVGILGAIPMIYRVVKKDKWAEVKDRHDQRLRDSFLTRMYVQGFVLIYTMLFKFNLSKTVDDFIKLPGMPQKTLPAV